MKAEVGAVVADVSRLTPKTGMSRYCLNDLIENWGASKLAVYVNEGYA